MAEHPIEITKNSLSSKKYNKFIIYTIFIPINNKII